jgi:hypothetical protein
MWVLPRKDVQVHSHSLIHKLVLILLVAACSTYTSFAQDVQVNSKDSNSPNLSNFTTESETSIARRGSLVVVGYNTSRQAGLVGAGAITSLSGYAYSTDGGLSFVDGGFVPANGTFVLQGDPALGFDSAGSLYYASLLEDASSNCSYIGISKSSSTSPSVVFGGPVAISGPGSCSGAFEDKEFLAVDSTGGSFSGRVYVAWSEFPPNDENPQALFAASTSTSPLVFGPTIALAPSASSFQHGTFPIVGPDGTVYVAWSTLTSISTAASATINLVKSTNGGSTFGNLTTVATFTSTVGDLGSGGMSLRTRSFPYLAVDNTPQGSRTRNNLYVVFQGQPGSAASPRSEIFFTSSTDGGTTWSAPRKISSGPAVTVGADTTNNDNWLPSISVLPATGHIRVLFYSRREDPANQKIRVYEAGSNDAGQTWYNRPFSAQSFTPSVGYDPLLVANYMGDYLSVIGDSDGLIGAWGDTRNLCSPPGGAQAPCGPSGRPDQDVWSREEKYSVGSDLAASLKEYVTGVGPRLATEKNPRALEQQASTQTSKETAKAATPQLTPPKQFRLVVPIAPAAVQQSVAEYVASQGLSLLQNDPEKRLISSSAIPLSHDQLIQSITPSAQKLVPENAVGKYFVTFKTTNAAAGAAASAQITVSTRILVVTSQDLDSPLGGRIVASNGALEEKHLNALTFMFNLK